MPEQRLAGLVGRVVLLVGLVVTMAGSGAGSGQAQESLPVPKSEVILEVTGAITESNAPDKALFDREMLLEIGASEVRTTTPWTDDVPVFRGVLVRDLLDRIGATGLTVVATAHNDYRTDIPVSDFHKYPVVLAYEMNGIQLRLRDKGPLWIVYPLDDYPELNDDGTLAKLVWQLKHLHVK